MAEESSIIRFTELAPRPGKAIELSSGASVGREGCDLVIDDPELSRMHARFTLASDGAVSVEDLGSSNGTQVNGQEIIGVRLLEPGATVTMGITRWRLEGSPRAAGTVIRKRPDARADSPSSPRPPAVSEPVPAPSGPATNPGTNSGIEAAAPPAAAAAQARGDVPAPQDPSISRVRPRPIELAAAASAPEFPDQTASGPIPRGRSQARSGLATAICAGIIIVVAIVLILYFALRDNQSASAASAVGVASHSASAAVLPDFG